ncbi:SDR family oxidoreductase [Aliishimia ponticola]|uniref:SDR family oxidoreductase n=1 Tax=Aliishimia ponticola TaxID=2499833 RepID=A0A4S4ND20_9RHOB|nr:SDR family oxidoreductase [Aliishimia ponticola]THH35948.1 SDR family oxidoreductase [Aliishimia ponticola]
MTHPIFPDLKDRSIYITGGGSGIGAALTDGFLTQGAKVAFIGRSDATAFCDAMEEKHGRRPLFLQGDVTDTARLQATIAEAAEAHGPLKALISNAANDQRQKLEDYSPEDWDANQAINLKAYYFATQAAAPLMRAAGGGSIINFSSISYMMGNAGYSAYVAANAGITGMTRAHARELGPDNIRVNAVAPGWVLTEKQLELWATPEDLSAHLQRQCLPRHLTPEDIVNPVLFLASDASAMMTAQCIVVDGGVAYTG